MPTIILNPLHLLETNSMPSHVATLWWDMLVISSHCHLLGPSSVSCLRSQVGISAYLHVADEDAQQGKATNRSTGAPGDLTPTSLRWVFKPCSTEWSFHWLLRVDTGMQVTHLARSKSTPGVPAQQLCYETLFLCLPSLWDRSSVRLRICCHGLGSPPCC